MAVMYQGPENEPTKAVTPSELIAQLKASIEANPAERDAAIQTAKEQVKLLKDQTDTAKARADLDALKGFIEVANHDLAFDPERPNLDYIEEKDTDLAIALHDLEGYVDGLRSELDALAEEIEIPDFTIPPLEENSTPVTPETPTTTSDTRVEGTPEPDNSTPVETTPSSDSERRVESDEKVAESDEEKPKTMLDHAKDMGNGLLDTAKGAFGATWEVAKNAPGWIADRSIEVWNKAMKLSKGTLVAVAAVGAVGVWMLWRWATGKRTFDENGKPTNMPGWMRKLTAAGVGLAVLAAFGGTAVAASKRRGAPEATGSAQSKEQTTENGETVETKSYEIETLADAAKNSDLKGKELVGSGVTIKVKNPALEIGIPKEGGLKIDGKKVEITGVNDHEAKPGLFNSTLLQIKNLVLTGEGIKLVTDYSSEAMEILFGDLKSLFSQVKEKGKAEMKFTDTVTKGEKKVTEETRIILETK